MAKQFTPDETGTFESISNPLAPVLWALLDRTRDHLTPAKIARCEALLAEAFQLWRDAA